MPRDPQKDLVYQAEDKIFESYTKNKQVYFKTIEEVQTYIDNIVDSAWWRANSGIRKVTAIRGKDTSKIAYVKRGRWTNYYGRTYSGSLLVVPFTWANHRGIILHELAHLMTHDDEPQHGDQFCRNYIKIVGRYISETMAQNLSKEFRKLGTGF